MQDWPLLIVRACTASGTTRSRSALGRTMKGSLPPSSRTLFLICRPAVAATLLPAASLPVSVTALTRESLRIPSTAADSTSSVWNAPSGKPARRKTSSIARAHWGTLEACFSSPTLPAIRAGAAKRKTCQKGKFQGITASTGPNGWYRTNVLLASVRTSSGCNRRSPLSA